MNKDAFDDLRIGSTVNLQMPSEMVTGYNQALDDVFDQIKKDPSKFGLAVIQQHPSPTGIRLVDEAAYEVPIYFVDNNGLTCSNTIVIRFCKGARDLPEAQRQEGFLTETLLQCCLEYLKSVNNPPLSSRYTSMAITNIETAMWALDARQKERISRGVNATSKA